MINVHLVKFIPSSYNICYWVLLMKYVLSGAKVRSLQYIHFQIKDNILKLLKQKLIVILFTTN